MILFIHAQTKEFYMSHNPLKQYFRRPSIYVKLPSRGKFYDSSVIEMPESEDLPVYPMSAIDEITSKTPDAVMNGQAVVDIVQSCIPNIKNAWAINSIDLDFLLVAIRVASSGEQMEIGSKCAKCDSESNYSIDLMQVLHTIHSPNYDQVLQLNDLRVKFKPLTWFETNGNNIAQFELQKILFLLQEYEDNSTKQTEIKTALNKLSETMTRVIVDTIEYIETPETRVTDREFIKEFLDNSDKNSSKLIRETSIDLKSEGQLKPLKIKCVNCSHEYEQRLVLNITDFFE